jgi:L,D-transpeptidase ErfK/SrfK
MRLALAPRQGPVYCTAMLSSNRSSSPLASLARVAIVGALALVAGGCALWPVETPVASVPEPVPVQPDPNAPRLAPLDTRQFDLISANEEVVGQPQVLFARYENTFSAIGREYDLGYEEMRRANPDVDQWLPGEGTPIYLPTESILPDAPREGIVINVPAMRLFYYASEKSRDDPAATTIRLTSHPIGVGAEGWATPFGEGKVTQKARDPVWYVPASVRKEHAERGDPLPRVVQPGPDNPLGKFAMALSLPGYLIHGTNKPSGVGMRVSHGCIRLYPEDIETLFTQVPKGTPVRLVNQPVLAGWRDGQLYLEVYPPLAEEQHDLVAEAEAALSRALERNGIAASTNALVDHALVRQIVAEQRGMPLPVLQASRSPEQYLANARIVTNTVPVTLVEQAVQVVETAGAAQGGGR